MNKLLATAFAAVLALTSTAVLAADKPKDATVAKTTAKALEKPASVSAEAWAKMTDAEKAKAVEAAKKEASTKEASAKPAKKDKKGGC